MFRSFAIVAICVTTAIAAVPVCAAEQNGAVKAAFIYNFARSTNWAPGSTASSTPALVLCVDPAEPLAGDLLRLDGKPLGSRRLTVRRVAPRSAGDCDLAYVSAGDASDGNLSALRTRGVLTIGETPNFTRHGAIRLVTIGNQVRFEVNRGNAQQVGASFSAQLLRAAVGVR